MSLAQSIREYAMRDTRSLQRDRDSMRSLEHCLVESFLAAGGDWDEHSLWGVEWRMFALIVAEALGPENLTEKQCDEIADRAFNFFDIPPRERDEGVARYVIQLTEEAISAVTDGVGLSGQEPK